MKNLYSLLIVSVAFAIGVLSSNVALSNIPNSKIAVVDVNAVVQKSVQVAALKKEQKMKADELQKWLRTVKADIDNQKTQESKDKLAKKYNSEFEKKKENISKDYQSKLKAIDTNITKTIENVAKSKGYDIVISKNVVLYGGDDITAAIQDAVK